MHTKGVSRVGPWIAGGAVMGLGKGRMWEVPKVNFILFGSNYVSSKLFSGSDFVGMLVYVIRSFFPGMILI